MEVVAPHVQAALRDYRAALGGAFPGRVRRVALFGSFARGEARDDSDVDVLVVLDRLSSGERGRAMDLGGEIGMAADLVMAPVVMSQAEWDEIVRRERLFASEIMRDGVDA